jgi:hypothetical protein
VAPIEESRLASLEAMLERLAPDPGHNTVVPFGKLPQCHFGRLFVWRGGKDQQGRPLDSQLLLCADCDGSASELLKQLVEVSGSGIDSLFSHCKQYPATPTGLRERLRFLERQRVEERAHYVHRPGRSVGQVVFEAKLRRAIDGFLASLDATKLSAVEVRTKVVEFVRADPTLTTALSRPDGLGPVHRAREAFDFVMRPLLLLLFGPVVVPTALAVLLLVRLRELRDHPPHLRPTAELLEQLTKLEDFSAHNAYSAGGFIKPGGLSRFTIESVLRAIDYGVRHLFTEDSLAGVRSIHFARWIPIDGRRMIFASVFDGSVESYNDDFINLLGWGLNLVFSNGEGYPRTRWLVFDGAKSQRPHPFLCENRGANNPKSRRQ